MKRLMSLASVLCTATILTATTAIKANAQDGAQATATEQQAPKISMTLVPWEPLLHRISAADRTMSFKLFGDLPEKLDGYTLTLTTSDSENAVSQALVNEVNKVVLPEGASKGKLTVKITNDATKDELFNETFPFAVITIPQVSATAHKRLNNLVTEILNDTIASNENEQSFSFSTVKDGWVFFAAKDAMADDLEIYLDGTLKIIDKSTARLESFREIPIGDHTLTIKGAKNGGQIIARSIVDIFNYCPGVDSMVKENHPYDWRFQSEYGLPAITTQNGGVIPEHARKSFRENGYHWLCSIGTTDLVDDEDLVRRLEASTLLGKDYIDGITCDEQFFWQPEVIARYTAGIKAFKNPDNKLIYTWIVGKPSHPLIDTAFISACLNASGSRGKLISEIYARTKATEAEARAYLDDFAANSLQKYNEYFPNADRSCGIIFGNFNQIPILSLQHHPGVDYKYYLDMQLNLVANNPAFANLGCTGYWGSYYADYELHRWSYMLLRHYCVEGKTTMLSDEYGFSYKPDHVQNGDFADGLEHWEAKGNISTGKKADFASRSQNRWGGNGGIGDTFVILSNKEGEVSSVSQKAVNLIPGKEYLLEFCTFDTDDVMAERIAPRKFAIEAILPEDEARIEYGPSWVHIDKREKGRYEHNMGARPNLHHYVFVPKKSEVTITLDNAGSKPGENLGINFFRVIPFLSEY